MARQRSKKMLDTTTYPYLVKTRNYDFIMWACESTANKVGAKCGVLVKPARRSDFR